MAVSNPVRAEIEIDAPIHEVWKILTELEGYAAWNPFTPRVESTLAVGDAIHLHVRLFGSRTFRWVETVNRNQPHMLGWEMQLLTPWLLHADRTQVLTPIDARRTRYVTEDRFRGWLAPVVVSLLGPAMERGFRACARGLREAAEDR